MRYKYLQGQVIHSSKPRIDNNLEKNSIVKIKDETKQVEMLNSYNLTNDQGKNQISFAQCGNVAIFTKFTFGPPPKKQSIFSPFGLQMNAAVRQNHDFATRYVELLR